MQGQDDSIQGTYILPIKHESIVDLGDLPPYLEWLVSRVQVVVVDGSPKPVFAHHRRLLPDSVIHVPVQPQLLSVNGKVGGVCTGIRHASHERLVIADDDVRYDDLSLRRIAALLDSADVVRPQNYFDDHPWHVLWDTGRTLLNRVWGGDWPGTLAVRRSVLQSTGGYDGNVMFENLELVRTILAAGGSEIVPLDLYIRRCAPETPQFLSQRLRQAYDELARPFRLLLSLSLLPSLLTLLITRRWKHLVFVFCAVAAVAETGRRRAGARKYFPAIATLFAPIWLLERALCIWLALGARILLGGVPYRGGIVREAATPMRTLRSRHRHVSILRQQQSRGHGEFAQRAHITSVA